MKDLMQKFGFSQRDLAKKSGVSHATINRFLNNKGNLTDRNMSAIAAVFGITISELKGEISKKTIIPKTVDQLPSDLKELLDLYMALPEGDWRKKAIHEILGIGKSPKKE